METHYIKTEDPKCDRCIKKGIECLRRVEMGKHRDKCIGCHAAKNRSDRCSLPKVDRSKWGPCERCILGELPCISVEGTDMCRRCKKNNYGCRRTPPAGTYNRIESPTDTEGTVSFIRAQVASSVGSRNVLPTVSTHSRLLSDDFTQSSYIAAFPKLPPTSAGVHPLEYFGEGMKSATISGGLSGAKFKSDSGGSTSTSSVAAHSASISPPDFSVVTFTETGHLQMDDGLTTFGLASIDGHQSSNGWENLTWNEVLEIIAS